MRFSMKPDQTHGGQDLMSNKFAAKKPKASIVPPYVIGALQVRAGFVLTYRHVRASAKVCDEISIHKIASNMRKSGLKGTNKSDIAS